MVPGFYLNRRLYSRDAAGGTAVSLSDTRNPFGLSWTSDRILLAVDTPRAIVEVSANGGAPNTLIAVDQARDEWVQSPQLVADGKAVLFTLRTGAGAWGEASIVVQDVATGERTVLVEGGTDGPGSWAHRGCSPTSGYGRSAATPSPGYRPQGRPPTPCGLPTARASATKAPTRCGASPLTAVAPRKPSVSSADATMMRGASGE